MSKRTIRGDQTRDRVFRFIVNRMRQTAGVPPTVQEISDEVGLASKSTGYYHLERLQREGRIEMDPVKARGIRVVGARWVFEEE